MPENIGKFIVQSLRNVARTAPYMHRGQMKTLEQVMEHYNCGAKVSSKLDSSLVHNGKLGIFLIKDELTKIIAFLKTLTDEGF